MAMTMATNAATSGIDDENDDKNDDQASVSSYKEALDYLLGGVDSGAFQETDWDHLSAEEEVEEKDHSKAEKKEDDGEVGKVENVPKSVVFPTTTSTSSHTDELKEIWKELMTRVHSTTDSGESSDDVNVKLEEPSVRIVDMSYKGKGFGLIATKQFNKGQVIFTEKAAIVAQIPQPPQSQAATQAAEEEAHRKPWQNPLYAVRACQECFRSMEPISTLADLGVSLEDKLPHPHLWPVMEYCATATTTPSSTSIRTDPFSMAIQCLNCQSLFCNKFCYNSHIKQFGNCCFTNQLIKTVMEWCASASASDDTNDRDEEEDSIIPNNSTMHEPLILSTKIFLMLLQRHRRTTNSQQQEQQQSTSTTTTRPLLDRFTGLCGQSSDLTPLEIGKPMPNTGSANNSQQTKYSIETLYNQICQHLSITPQEEAHLTLQLLEQLTSMCARNGHNLATQSPFTPYYRALLRQVSPRGSPQHLALQKQIALALGNSSGKLEKEMDDLVDNKVCVTNLCGIFPLLARTNHSCKPNATGRKQEFVDAYIDVVALRNIHPGEEITTGYIPTTLRKSTRQKLLQSKYLFWCQCEVCSTT